MMVCKQETFYRSHILNFDTRSFLASSTQHGQLGRSVQLQLLGTWQSCEETADALQRTVVLSHGAWETNCIKCGFYIGRNVFPTYSESQAVTAL